MSKNKKKKTGLQRDVSAIFSGVPIPPKKGHNNSGQPPKESAPENTAENTFHHPLHTPHRQPDLTVEKPEKTSSTTEDNITPQSSEQSFSGKKVESPLNRPLYTPDRQTDLPIEKPEETSSPTENNITPQFSKQSFPEKKVESPLNQPLYTPDRQTDLPIEKPNKPISPGENNITRQPVESPVPESKSNITSEPPIQEPQNHPVTLIQKLNQPDPVENNHVQKKPPESAIQKQAGNIPLKPSQNQTQRPQSSLLQKLNQPPELLRKNSPTKQKVNDEPKENIEPQVVVTVSQWQQLKDKLFTPKPGVSPARQKATVILIPVLAVVLIFIVRQVFWSAPKKIKGADNDASVVQKSAKSGSEIEWKIPEPYPSTLRDPMYLVISNTEKKKPETINNETEITIAVKGVLFSEDNPAALIGNKIVHVGDVVSGAEIINIGRDSVTFEINGRRWKENVRQDQ